MAYLIELCLSFMEKTKKLVKVFHFRTIFRRQSKDFLIISFEELPFKNGYNFKMFRIYFYAFLNLRNGFIKVVANHSVLKHFFDQFKIINTEDRVRYVLTRAK